MRAAVLDLFAGPGGWSEGLRALGLTDVGIEWDPSACATRAAAGHLTIRADVAAYPTRPFADVEGLIASPPCQDFSRAGKRKGLAGDRGQLVWQVPRWVDALRPSWVACEQVPDVLSIWRLICRELEAWGYRTWCGLLRAEQYGVPQTRERAILMASRERAVVPPEPTHQRYRAGEPATEAEAGLFGAGLLAWVSMAEALGWGMTERPGMTIVTRASGGGSPEACMDGGSGARRSLAREQTRGAWVSGDSDDRRPVERLGVGVADEPLSVVGEVPDQFRDELVAGAVGVDGQGEGVSHGADDDCRLHDVKGWPYERPATAVCGDPRLSPPGYRGRPGDYGPDGDYRGKRSMDEAVKLTIAEALTLQGFRPDYPVQGTKTKQFEQVGNAIPPPLAAAILRELIDIGQEAAA